MILYVLDLPGLSSIIGTCSLCTCRTLEGRLTLSYLCCDTLLCGSYYAMHTSSILRAQCDMQLCTFLWIALVYFGLLKCKNNKYICFSISYVFAFAFAFVVA